MAAPVPVSLVGPTATPSQCGGLGHRERGGVYRAAIEMAWRSGRYPTMTGVGENEAVKQEISYTTPSDLARTTVNVED
jgi:hypothetical protein